MEIDLGQEIVFKVKLGANCYELREPTLRDVKKLRAQDDDEEKAFEDFLIDLGMPKDVLENLGVFKLKKLSESLISTFNEKK